MNADDELREMLDFAAKKFVIRLDGSQVVALINGIELACRHPLFKGASRQACQQINEHLRRIARTEVPSLNVVHEIFALDWSGKLPPPSYPDSLSGPVRTG